MNRFIKLLRLTISILLPTLVVAGVVYAGTLTAPSGTPSATSYTLDDLYTKLTTNADATATNHSLSTTTSPAASFHTLTQLYDAIPTIDATKVLSGTSYLGIAGAVAVKTGDNAVTGGTASGTSLLLVPPSGYYDGVATVSTTSPFFIAGNIANGVNLFGITGSLAAGYTYGDSDASKVLTTATGVGTYDASNLSTGNVKAGITYGAGQTGALYSTGPRTGQTICYDAAAGSVVNCSGTGQDGEYLKGVARSYTDNGEATSTITDNVTGLTWQKCTRGYSGTTCATGAAVPTTWANALTYCNSNTDLLPGSGWRLPNVYELYSIIDFGKAAAPFADATYFPATVSNNYWTSTSRPGSFSSAMAVVFTNGITTALAKSINEYVRCVRG